MKRKGFALTEAVIYAAVILILGSATVITGKNYLSMGRYSTAKTQAGALALAVSHYRFEMGSYPTTLNALTIKSGTHGPWIDSDALKDPWNRNYQYVYDNTNKKFAVWSSGANHASESSISGISGDDCGTLGH